MTEMKTRNDLVAEARKWLGVPFRHQGRNRFGADCAGVVIGSFSAIGHPVEDIAGYKLPFTNSTDIREIFSRHMDAVGIREAGAGDVMLFDLGERWPIHMAIVGETEDGRLTLIHTSPGLRRCKEHGLDDEWLDRAVAAYRMKE
jgi:cell wall-associated NlpC family hydrolase